VSVVFRCNQLNCTGCKCVVECRNLIHQLIEPNPELRIPMSEIHTNLWITHDGKCPFVPYVAPAKNRVMRNQVSYVFHSVLKAKFHCFDFMKTFNPQQVKVVKPRGSICLTTFVTAEYDQSLIRHDLSCDFIKSAQ